MRVYEATTFDQLSDSILDCEDGDYLHYEGKRYSVSDKQMFIEDYGIDRFYQELSRATTQYFEYGSFPIFHEVGRLLSPERKEELKDTMFKHCLTEEEVTALHFEWMA